MNSNYEKLFEGFTFKNGVTIKNRIIMTPMHSWSSNDDHTVSHDELKYYEKRSKGVGLLITGCTPVQPSGIGFTSQMAAYDDKFIPSLKKLAEASKSGGAPAILQIFHAGNKALSDLIPNGDIVSSSAVETETSSFAPSITPRELSNDEIIEIVHAFGEATRRAIEAGFDGVEIHGAHGFLLQNFTSPYFNKRQDQWGGSLENRLRFSIEVVKEIKNTIKKYATKPFILGYRISPDEPQEGGLRMKDTYELISHIIEEGVDYVHASLINALTAKPFDSQDEKTYLELIIEHVNGRVPLIAAGCMQTPEEVKKALEKGLPLAAIGHALVMNPDWVEKVENGKEAEIETTLKPSKLKQLEIPEKLWTVIKASGSWFNIEE